MKMTHHTRCGTNVLSGENMMSRCDLCAAARAKREAPRFALKKAPWRITGPSTNADDLAASIKRIQDDVRRNPRRSNSHMRISGPTYDPATQPDVRVGTAINAKSQDAEDYGAEIREPGGEGAVDYGEDLTSDRRKQQQQQTMSLHTYERVLAEHKILKAELSTQT